MWLLSFPVSRQEVGGRRVSERTEWVWLGPETDPPLPSSREVWRAAVCCLALSIGVLLIKSSIPRVFPAFGVDAWLPTIKALGFRAMLAAIG